MAAMKMKKVPPMESMKAASPAMAPSLAPQMDKMRMNDNKTIKSDAKTAPTSNSGKYCNDMHVGAQMKNVKANASKSIMSDASNSKMNHSYGDC